MEKPEQPTYRPGPFVTHLSLKKNSSNMRFDKLIEFDRVDCDLHQSQKATVEMA